MKQNAVKQLKNTNAPANTRNKPIWIGMSIVCLFVLLCIVFPPAMGSISDYILGVFGLVSYPLFLALGLYSLAKIRGRSISVSRGKVALLLVAIVSLICATHIMTTYKLFVTEFKEYIKATFDMSYSMGGVVVGVLDYGIASLITPVGATILFFAVGLLCLWLFSGKSAKGIYKRLKLVSGNTVQVGSVNNSTQESDFVNTYNPAYVMPSTNNSLYVGTIEPSRPMQAIGDMSQINIATAKHPSISIFGQDSAGALPMDTTPANVRSIVGYTQGGFGGSQGYAPLQATPTMDAPISDDDRRARSRQILFGDRDKLESTYAADALKYDKAIANAFLGSSYEDTVSVGSIMPTTLHASIGASIPSNSSAIIKPPKFVQDETSVPLEPSYKTADSNLDKLSIESIMPKFPYPKIMETQEFFPGDIINGDVESDSINSDSSVVETSEFVSFGAKSAVDIKTYKKPVANKIEDDFFRMFKSESVVQSGGYVNNAPLIDADYFEIKSIDDNRAKKNILAKSGEVESLQCRTPTPIEPVKSYAQDKPAVSKKKYLEEDFDIVSDRVQDDSKDIESSFYDLYSREAAKEDRDSYSSNIFDVIQKSYMESSSDSLATSTNNNIHDGNPTWEEIESELDKFISAKQNISKQFKRDFDNIDNDSDYDRLDDIGGSDGKIDSFGTFGKRLDLGASNSGRSLKNTRTRVSKLGANQTQMNDDILQVDRHTDIRPSVRKKKIRFTAPKTVLLDNLTVDIEDNSDEINQKADILKNILKDFGLEVEITGKLRGPAVTRYELSMPSGVSVKKIEQYASDIAYYLESKGGIRIETPIPGKRAIGIEVPNNTIATVGLKDILESDNFSASQSPLTVALGKGIAGEYVVASLDQMPHLLIAGATNSGKSACLNTIITSLIYKSTPDDVRLLLIDPKRVEFNIYSSLPHLLVKNIVTEPEHAINAFEWAIKEMERRYALLSKHYAKNISDYNKIESVRLGESEKLAYIVIIVDELADLMMTNKRVVEDKIRAIAQKARAAGIHLVLATQRPSVDVVTGTIKTNLPSRIAFAVTSYADSKTILDASGAENLLGRGDMLFMSINSSVPKRVQGAYITSEEVSRVVAFCKDNNVCEYNIEAEEEIFKVKHIAEPQDSRVYVDENASDDLFERALFNAIMKGSVSVTAIQTTFRIGYVRASRIVSQMEENKFVGASDGAKARKVLLSMDDYKQLYPEAYDELNADVVQARYGTYDDED